MQNLVTIKAASRWASTYIGKTVSPANIAYLVQYGKISKNKYNNNTYINLAELEGYYKNQKPKQQYWQSTLGNDLNWHLSFQQYKESETTKHVHRLHAYKGKFIPQLVEYFLDGKTDTFKQQVFFKASDSILDPFCGSGTTLVQANELGLHAVGIDISAFNAFISNVKLADYNRSDIIKTAKIITKKLKDTQSQKQSVIFEVLLSQQLKAFNRRFFPVPDFRYWLRQKKIDEKSYSQEKQSEFLKVYQKLVNQYQIQLQQNKQETFLDKWFLQPLRDEIDFIFKQIQQIENKNTKKLLALVLSRTMRSCRATTHADLGTLKTPITRTYYCKKHSKICKPIFSTLNWWQRYIEDTIKRLDEFSEVKTNTLQKCLVGDSRTLDITKALSRTAPKIGKFNGIFSSPPYVGLINYHEQHAYAYDLLGFKREDALEIGALFKGQGLAARKSYVSGIADVLNHCKQYLKPDYNIFLVANDKYNLYPHIVKKSAMRIVNQYKRPVLNRVEKSRSAYAEIIFHLKAQ